MMLRGILTAQKNFKAHGAARRPALMGLSVFLHLSEFRPLTHWRMLILINALSGVFALLGV